MLYTQVNSKFGFSTAEKLPRLNDRKSPNISQYEVTCDRFNPGALTQSKNQILSSLGYNRKLDKMDQDVVKILNPGQLYVAKYSIADYEEKFHIKHLASLAFRSEKDREQAAKDCPWLIKKTSLGKENRELGQKYAEQIKTGYCVPVIIAWISDEIGYGLLSSKIIEEGDYIGEYTGVCFKVNRFKRDYTPYSFKYPTKFFSFHYWIIDAEEQGGFLRFLNHSDDPNLEPAWLMDEQNLLHICFFAKRRINRGEQLTFDYGDDYWLKRIKQPN